MVRAGALTMTALLVCSTATLCAAQFGFLRRGADVERRAVAALRDLYTAQTTYKASYPDVGFACELVKLGPTTGVPTADSAGLIGASLATGLATGYRFEIRGCEGDSYEIVATPVNAGTRVFCTDERGIVRYGTQKCTRESPALP